MLVNLKIKHILIIAIIYEIILISLHYLFYYILIGTPLSALYNFIISLRFIIDPILIFSALFFSNKVKEKTIKLKSYLEDKLEDKKSSQWIEQQYNKWTSGIYGKLGLIIFFLIFFFQV